MKQTPLERLKHHVTSAIERGEAQAIVGVEQAAPRADITLANGRVVTHARLANGSQSADMADGGNMSETEWEEYCAILAKSNAAFIERQRRLRRKERIAANKAAAKAWSV